MSMAMFIDDYLNCNKEKMDMMKEIGMEMYPVDEHGICVPLDKKESNIETVEESMNKAHGLK